MAEKKRRNSSKSPKKGLKSKERPVITVKINNSPKIEDLIDSKEQEIEETPKNVDDSKSKISSYAVYAVIGIVLVLAVYFGYQFMQGQTNPNPQSYTFPMLNNDSMVCGDNAVCVLRNGTWYRPDYNAGTNLTAANRFSAENATEIGKFFKSSKINLVLGSLNTSDPKNAELITTAAPFSYYIGYYYTYKGENKTITAYLLSEYNSSEPAVFILGPDLGATETSLKFDGKNVIAQAESFDELKVVLGKLLLLAIKGS